MSSDDLLQRYQTWRGKTRGAVAEALEVAALLEWAGDVRGRRLLDAGCGDGAFAVAAAERGARVTGIDLSPQMLAAAQARAAAAGVDIQWRPADVRALPFPPASFDLAWAITLLCLIQQPESAVRELTRVLAPGGRLLVGDLHRWSWWAARRRLRGWRGDPLWRGARFWTAGELHRLLRQSGLKPARTRGVVYFPPFDWAARSLAPLDPLLARLGTFGAAFLVVEGVKPDR